jgi:WD repeat/SOCS box-containing protein 1
MNIIMRLVVGVLPPRESQAGELDRGDKSFSCGEPVWGLAFGPRPPKSPALSHKNTQSKGDRLLLATGLENGAIKIWNVLTGEILFILN